MVLYMCRAHSCSEKLFRKVLVFAVGLFVLVSVYASFFVTLEKYAPMRESHSRRSIILSNGTKTILFWTKFFQSDMPNLHDSLTNCPVPHCHLTQDRSLLLESAAVVFHGNHDLYFHPDDIPAHRSPEQVYVYFNLEAPTSYENINLRAERWKHFFNLTWTYRLDSDVFANFYMSEFYRNAKPAATGWNIKGKKNRAMTFISNCVTRAKREEYIRELQKYFPVDVVGSCGEAICAKGAGRMECEKRLTGQYKFYLAFENSVCKDYVTEKPFRALTFGSVPVVRGGANYSRFLPSGSFIDASSFADASQLAAYLHIVSNDDDLYARFFEWRQQDRTFWTPVNLVANSIHSSVCRLCEILHEPGYLSTSVDDLYGWYTNTAGSSICLPPGWWDWVDFYFSHTILRIRWFMNM